VIVAALLVALLGPARAPQDDASRIASFLERLDRGSPEEVAEALTELGDLAPEAALRALSEGDLPADDLRLRRARAWLVEQAGDERCIPGALRLLEDPDAEVRAHAARLLAEPELRDASADERARALERVALDDSEADLRRLAVTGLGRIGRPQAIAALARLVDRATPPERGLAARALSLQPGAREVVVERVRTAFSSGQPAADDALLQLLAAYGTALAELPGGGESVADRVPFVLGRRHPDPRLVLEAGRALERFVQRLRVLGDIDRADRMYARLVGEGLDDGELRAQRAILALEEGVDPQVALDVARELVARSPARIDDLETRKRHAAGRLLEAAALLALDRPGGGGSPGNEGNAQQGAEQALDGAESALLGLVQQRLDLRSKTLAVDHAGALESLALVHLYRALALLAAGNGPDDPRVLEHARTAHERSLDAQLALLRGLESPQTAGLDNLLLHPLGPVALLFQNPRNEHLPRARALVLEQALCRALATVAPQEVPGFEPLATVEPRLTTPLKDPQRKALLQQIQTESYVAQRKDIERRIDRLEPDDPNRLAWQRALRALEQDRLRNASDPQSLLRWREPSSAGLVVSGHLREEGEFQASRLLAERVKRHLDERNYETAVFQTGWTMEEFKARTDLRIGNAWMDEEQPQRAEQVLQEGLDRLEVLERDLEDNGVGPAGLQLVQRLQSDALVSLAVNANVKLRDPDRAVEYFERAYALRQDDFTRILLACYRARVGRDDEARELMAQTPILPGNYYNLACTYALMGEPDLALDFLQRDFEEIRSSPGALERQQEWARGDPDLASLRGLPRFEALTAP